MRQMTLDETMVLFADDGAANANVSFVFVYDQGTAPGATVRLKAIVNRIEARLGEFPLLRQRALRAPLDCDLPYWVDDESFHLEHHVRHIALPKPGDWRQFCILTSRIHARALDISRPLWEIYVIEGLDCLLDLPAGSFALVFKAHYAILGDRTSRDIAHLLNDRPTSQDRERADPWFPANAPSSVDLLTRAAFNVATTPLRFAAPLVRLLPLAHALLLASTQQREESAMTRFNAAISPSRVFETRRYALEEIDEIRALADRLSVHDVLLAVCGDGLRRYLAYHEEAPTLPITVAVPAPFLDRRAADPENWRVIDLMAAEGDPVARLMALRDGRGHAGNDLNERRPLLAGAGKAFGALKRLGAWAPVANCYLIDLPAPNATDLVGARMTYHSSLCPIYDGMGLAFTTSQFDGKVILSFTACFEQVSDPERLAQDLRDAFQDLLAVARETQTREEHGFVSPPSAV